MPGRKPLYQSEAERPVTLCVRVPRELYEQVQHQMDIRRMSLTDAALDALRLWVETPADPRDTGVSLSGHTTVLQEFEERVDARLEALEAALATLKLETPVSTERIQPASETVPYDDSNTNVIQESAVAMPATTEPSAVLLGETRNVRLGSLCPRGHDYNGTGKSLRRATRAGDCVECGNEQKRARRRAAKAALEGA
jgi:hypothetical protein